MAGPRSKVETRLYQREWRARKRVEAAAGGAVERCVEDAVLLELDSMSAVPDPVMAEAAIRLARLLDDPTCQPQYVRATESLAGVMKSLRDGVTRPTGKLAVLRAGKGVTR